MMMLIEFCSFLFFFYRKWEEGEAWEQHKTVNYCISHTARWKQLWFNLVAAEFGDSVGEGKRCYTTSGLPILPHKGCYSTKDSAKWKSDRSRLKCSDCSHLPSVSIALFHFQSLLSSNRIFALCCWLTYPLSPLRHMQPPLEGTPIYLCSEHRCSVFARYTPKYQHPVEVVRRSDRYLCQPAEVRQRQLCTGMQPRMKVEVTIKSEWMLSLRKCTW